MEKNREEGRYWVKTKMNPNDWAVALFTPFHKSPDHFPWFMNGGYVSESYFLVVNPTRILNPDEKKAKLDALTTGVSGWEEKARKRADEVTPTNTGEKAEPLEIWLRCQTCNGEGSRYTSKFGHTFCDNCLGAGTIRKEIPAPLVNKEEVREKEDKLIVNLRSDWSDKELSKEELVERRLKIREEQSEDIVSIKEINLEDDLDEANEEIEKLRLYVMELEDQIKYLNESEPLIKEGQWRLDQGPHGFTDQPVLINDTENIQLTDPKMSWEQAERILKQLNS